MPNRTIHNTSQKEEPKAPNIADSTIETESKEDISNSSTKASRLESDQEKMVIDLFDGKLME